MALLLRHKQLNLVGAKEKRFQPFLQLRLLFLPAAAAAAAGNKLNSTGLPTRRHQPRFCILWPVDKRKESANWPATVSALSSAASRRAKQPIEAARLEEQQYIGMISSILSVSRLAGLLKRAGQIKATGGRLLERASWPSESPAEQIDWRLSKQSKAG